VPYSNSTISNFFNTKAATMNRFSSNITGLSPVTKKTSPTKVNQEKAKEGAKQEQPGLSRESRKSTNNKKTQKTAITNNNLSQTKHTPPQSPPWDPPPSLPKGERKREKESVTAAATDSIKLSVDDCQRRSTTSTIINAPARTNTGIDKENKGSTATITGSLFQKLVTLAAANLGSCDKNPGMADTTGMADTRMDTGAIFGGKEAGQRG
jgi:hypothetical protein